MRKLFLLFLLLPFSLSAIDSYHEIAVGYNQDLGAYMGIRVEDSSIKSPFFIQARGGYIYQEDPGNASEARKIFINDNAGGTITKYGESTQGAIDLGYKWKDLSTFSLELNMSGIYNFYQAHFTYIGNNESFAVKTTSYGIGLGSSIRMPIKKSTNSFMLKFGIEYYLKSTLEAHGTYIYAPNGNDDNPRNDYTYEDADNAVNQPEFKIYFLAGLLYKIG